MIAWRKENKCTKECAQFSWEFFKSYKFIKTESFSLVVFFSMMNKMFLVRFTNCYLAFTPPKLVLNQCNNRLWRTSSSRQLVIPAPSLCPKDQQAISVKVNVSLLGSLCAREENEVQAFRPVSTLGGSSAPFFLPTPPRSCSEWKNIHLFLWKWENKEHLLLLAQRLRTKGNKF